MLQIIAADANVKPHQVEAVIKLLEDGNTVPFIARYRKEATGSLDEVQIKAIEDRYHYIQQLEQRKEEVLRLIDEQGQINGRTVNCYSSSNGPTTCRRFISPI